MVGFGGATAFRDWRRAWKERFDRLDAYLRRLRENEGQPPQAGSNPDEYHHRRN